MRSGGDADTVHVGHPKSEPERHPEPDALGEPVRDRDRRRVHDALPIAVCDGFNLAERYPESLSLALSPPPRRIIKAGVWSRFVGQTMRPSLAKASRDELQLLRELIEAGKVTPVIDRTYPLSESADAIRDLETGHARGRVVISVSDSLA
ncbi:MAG: zinc-binding dehydrogenase [Candidatus Dormibacteraeota bacterium]|nr:zinc-binding dehydrogenase [Candidatus Dormibacteraeota bacterium]